MTVRKSATTIARELPGRRREKTTHARILVWAGLLAFYPAPSWGQNWTPAPAMPTARYSLAAAASPDGKTIYALGGSRAIGFSRGFDVAARPVQLRAQHSLPV